MKKPKLPRNTLVQSSLERKNNLGKGGIIQSIRDKEKYDRTYQKSQWKKESRRSGDTAPLFYSRFN